MVRVEAGDERTELVGSVTKCLNEDGRLNLSVDGVKPGRWREQPIGPQSLGKPPLLWFRRGGWSRHRGQRWRTSCLTPSLCAVEEEVMLLADKREKVVGGSPKRIQWSLLSRVSGSVVSVT